MLIRYITHKCIGDLGGVQGIIRSALYGYRLVGNIAELYRRKHNNCGDTDIVLEEMVEK